MDDLKNDPVRRLIEVRLAELHLSRNKVSKLIGRNETYLHQFLHRGTPPELMERDRIALAAILQVPEDALRGPLTQRSPALPASGARAQTTPGMGYFSLNNDLPVYGTAVDPAGALRLTPQAVDFVARPYVLLRVRDAYGALVDTDIMAPEHKRGSTALVHPHQKPRPSDACILRHAAEDGAVTIRIVEYRGESDTHWKVHQHNPPKTHDLAKSQWPECHRIIGNLIGY